MAAVNVNPPQLTPQDIKRFWSKIDKSPGQGPKGKCWGWIKSTRASYGTFSTCHAYQKRSYLAHRISFFIATGIWSNLYVCHKCDYHLCCNPADLFEGTARQNYEDAAAKGRATRGEKTGTSKLTESQVLEIRRLRAVGVKPIIIAGQFHISRSHVSLITGKRSCWDHLK